MMNRILKTLLILLVIASLPLRGLAAVDMSCATGPHSPSEMTAEMKHHQDRTHHLEAHDELSASGSDHSDNKEQSDGQSHLQSTGCSASACFIGAVAPPLSLVWAERFVGSEAVTSLPPISFAGHIPAGLERPPRHFQG